jgi:hypothetical protein
MQTNSIDPMDIARAICCPNGCRIARMGEPLGYCTAAVANETHKMAMFRVLRAAGVEIVGDAP